MLAGDLDLARKRQVVAHKHAGADHQTSGIGFVVGVAKAEDVSVIFADFLAIGNLEEREIPQTIASEGVLFVNDPHTHPRESGGHLVIQGAV
jgi:hypothetical protein